MPQGNDWQLGCCLEYRPLAGKVTRCVETLFPTAARVPSRRESGCSHCPVLNVAWLPPPSSALPPPLQGMKMAERKRVFAWYARRGMPHAGNHDAHVHPSSRNPLYRARLLLNLSTWTAWGWMKRLVHMPLALLLGLFGQSL